MHVVCPGSFDPITNGHVDIIERAAAQFDQVTVLVTFNPNKHGLFSVEERCDLIRKAVEHLPNVDVDSWNKLLVDYTTEHQISALVKGLRSSLDYAYEFGHISSTLCKEVARYGGDVSGLMPDHVIEAMQKKFSE